MIIVNIILSLILPPLAVLVKEGLGTNFWISLILTILAWVPGVIFALYITVFKNAATT